MKTMINMIEIWRNKEMKSSILFDIVRLLQKDTKVQDGSRGYIIKEIEVVFDKKYNLKAIFTIFNKVKDKDEIMSLNLENQDMNKYDNYVAFILGRSFLTDVLPNEDDTAYDICVTLAKDFELSRFNVNTKSLYECVQEYVEDLLKDFKNDDIMLLLEEKGLSRND